VPVKQVKVCTRAHTRVAHERHEPPRLRRHCVSVCTFVLVKHVNGTSKLATSLHTSASVSIRQHSSVFVSIRQHTSAYARNSPRAAAPAPPLWCRTCS
jgi:hypothetical protein